ncbi:MAG: hypothetical protein ACREFE_09670 [Limisphaerales bacterium]
MGERLFLETRFAEFFFTNSGGNANYQLPDGDPALNGLQIIYGPAPELRGISLDNSAVACCRPFCAHSMKITRIKMNDTQAQP